MRGKGLHYRQRLNEIEDCASVTLFDISILSSRKVFQKRFEESNVVLLADDETFLMLVKGTCPSGH